jgi:regulator of sigma E protease
MFEFAAFPLETVLGFVSSVLVFLAALAALIFVHELGHFLIARKCGVEVEKFSLGFGPKIVGFTQGKTSYMISAIPLGGYVKMKGEDPSEELSDKTGSFSNAPVQHRLAIAFGGPLFNILFAILIYVVVYMNGAPNLGTAIGTVKEGSPAAVAGLQSDDRIVEIDGTPVRFWENLQKVVHGNPGKQMDFMVERGTSKVVNIAITPVSEETTNIFGEKEKVGLIGVTPLVQDVTYVEEKSAAEAAGFKVGDKVLSIDSNPFHGWMDLKEYAIDKPEQQVIFKVSRDGSEIEIPITPREKTVKDSEGKSLTIGELGLGLTGEMIIERYGVFGSLKRSFEETIRMTVLICQSIKKMIFGTVSAESIGGPILIFQIYDKQAEEGFNQTIRLTALLSINLGLLNLLPIPILDGGHILFFLIEAIKGRPVSDKNRERAHQVGFFILISLMVFAFYNDIMRVIS